jgi:tetratricopeptide (TPR) repeat protein
MRLVMLIAGAALAVPAATPADPDTAPAGGPICGAEAPAASTAPATALLAGYGTGGFAVATANPQAQAYFDNGMQLAHAFAHKPAIAAFQQAVRLDPTCAMCAWGEAWARGPTINYDIPAKDQAELAVLADRAAALARNGPKKEQQLTAALQLRYRNGGGKGAGDYAFARAMDQLARDYPSDNEIAIIAADAWMIPASLKETRENLTRALELLTAALARRPDDTGAIHFYIHATENDGIGGAAERYADTLQRLAPAASHLVHMPSHTYYLVGRYQDAVRSNLDAVTIDAANARRQGFGDDVWKLTYHAHNVQFAMGAALMSGDAGAALSQSDATLAHARTGPKADAFLQMVVGTAYFAQARFATPDRVLALPDPGAEHAYERAMWRYARGEAYARMRDAAGVRREAALVAADPAVVKSWGGYAPQAAGMVEVARLVLTGRAAMIEGRPDAAAQAYRAAAQIQDARLGRLSDPPGWWYPVRRSLAAALLAAGRADDAATEARLTLKTWPNDPVTLALLAQAEGKLGDGKAADLHLAQAEQGWRGGARVPAGG